MSKYINHNIQHGSSLTTFSESLTIKAITSNLVFKYRIARIMERVMLLLIFLSFFSAIAAYFFKDGDQITLLAGLLFFGGFIGAIASILLLIYFITRRQNLQPFAYLIYQIKAVDTTYISELIVPCDYDNQSLIVALNDLIATNNLPNYQLVKNTIITNNRYYDNYLPPKQQKKNLSNSAFPSLDVLYRNVYRFKRINIFLANHFLILMIVSFVIFLILFIVNVLRTDTTDAIVAMKVIFIPFFSVCMIFTFAYNILIVNATNRIEYYELIETILAHEEIKISQLEINGITNIPLLTFIIKQLIKTKSLKGYYLEKNLIKRK